MSIPSVSSIRSMRHRFANHSPMCRPVAPDSRPLPVIRDVPLASRVLRLNRRTGNGGRLLFVEDTSTAKPSRRWLLGFEPLFEEGWFHKGTRSRSWGVEETVEAISLLGDVTIDLTSPRSLPHSVGVQAYAIGRDVEVLVRPGTRVELSGRANNDHLNSEVADTAVSDDDHVIKVTGHTFLGDVTVRSAARCGPFGGSHIDPPGVDPARERCRALGS